MEAINLAGVVVVGLGAVVLWSKKVGLLDALIKNFQNRIDDKKSTIKNRSMRGEDFYFRGILDKNEPKKIPLNADRVKYEDIRIAFNPFNNRFNVFGPSTTRYKDRTVRRQMVAKNPFGKAYSKNLSLFHGMMHSEFVFNDGARYDPVNILNSSKRITWIKGDIGCGKSTLISNICHVAAADVNIGNRAIMCINFSEDKLKIHYEIDVEDSASCVESNEHEKIVYSILNEAFLASFREMAPINSVDDFVGAIKKHFPYTPVTIIIDNLDAFYDQSSKLIFEQKEYRSEYKEFYKNQTYTHIAVEWLNFVLRFLVDPKAPETVNFIFGIRCETYDALMSTVNKELSHPVMGINLPDLERKIAIKTPSIDDLIDKRFEMVETLHPNIGDHADLKDFFHMYGEQSIDLKVYGMRHLVSSLNEFSSMGVNIFSPSWMMDIYIYLDGYQRYSQCNSGIINIFLVNINYRIDGDKTRIHKKYPEFSKADHFQTYWLRYFLALYFYKNVTTEAIDADMLYEYFDSYERGIFNSSLYSLTRDTHGRLISCNYNHNKRDANDYILVKQDRLNILFEKNIIFSFSYLAVIVDDDYLEVPILPDKTINDELKKIFDTPYIYDSIFSKDGDWDKWLFLSIGKVYTFLNILKISFENHEKKKVGFLSAADIDFNDFFSELNEQVRSIADTLSIPLEKVEERINEAIAFNSRIEDALVMHFRCYSKFVDEFTVEENCTTFKN